MPEKEKEEATDQRDELIKLQEKVRALEEEAQKRKSVGVAGAALRGVSRMLPLPGLSDLIEGLEESEAFRERLRTTNEKIEMNIKKSLKEGSHDEVRHIGTVKDFGGIRDAHVTCTVSTKPLVNEKPSDKRVAQGDTFTIEEKEPLIDIFNEKNHLIVAMGVPGAEKLEDIKLNVAGGVLTVSTDASKGFLKEVKLPCSTETDIANATYVNGILEVKLRKLKNDNSAPSKEEGI
jgi:HSP20 family protein